MQTVLFLDDTICRPDNRITLDRPWALAKVEGTIRHLHSLSRPSKAFGASAELREPKNCPRLMMYLSGRGIEVDPAGYDLLQCKAMAKRFVVIAVNSPSKTGRHES